MRFCMPTTIRSKLITVAGHWMSWAHASAMSGQVLNDKAWTVLVGANRMADGQQRLRYRFISGISYNNPIPHSRLLSTIISFMNGFRGTREEIFRMSICCHRDAGGTWRWMLDAATAQQLLALLPLLPASTQNNKLGVGSHLLMLKPLISG